MPRRLKPLFATILLCMVAVTVRASLDRSVFTAAGELIRDPWGLATLADAYFGFVTFYAWVFYKEAGGTSRAAWFVAIMAFGNIAMALYMLWQLAKLPRDARPADLLLRPQDHPA